MSIVLPGEKIKLAGGETVMQGQGTYRLPRKCDEESSDEEDGYCLDESSSSSEDDAEVLDDEAATTTRKNTGENRPRLAASVSGMVTRTNSLVSVRAVCGRYRGQTGDLVVGTVLEVGHKVWKIDLGATRTATLALSSVHLPNDAQRIRTRQDALAMRQIFREGDVVVAEIQQSRPDGPPSLQTRSSRYGKLSEGLLVKVQSCLIKRLKAHFVTLPERDVDLVIGVNGWIWVQRRIPEDWIEEAEAEDRQRGGGGGIGAAGGRHLSTEAWIALRKRHAALPLTKEHIDAVYRAAAACRVLGSQRAAVTPVTVDKVVELSRLAFPDDPTVMTQYHYAYYLVKCLMVAESSFKTAKALYLDDLIKDGASRLGPEFDGYLTATPEELQEKWGGSLYKLALDHLERKRQRKAKRRAARRRLRQKNTTWGAFSASSST